MANNEAGHPEAEARDDAAEDLQLADDEAEEVSGGGDATN